MQVTHETARKKSKKNPVRCVIRGKSRELRHCHSESVADNPFSTAIACFHPFTWIVVSGQEESAGQVSTTRLIVASLPFSNSASPMKMIFSTKTRRLLGVHILGEGATELIHIGQAVLNLKGTIDYFIQNTFNYPTLAEAYKIAGLDAWNRMTR